MKITWDLAFLGAVAFVFLVAPQVQATENATDEDAGKKYMENLNELMAKAYNKDNLIVWAYDSNITDYNGQQTVTSSLELAALIKENWAKTITFPWQNYTDVELKRMFKRYSELGTPALSDDKYQTFTNVVNDMETTYATATICDYKNRTNCDLHLDPEISDILTTSTDPEELKYTWLEWHKAAGAPSKSNFTLYVELDNEAARLNGYNNTAEWWLSDYETPDIEDQFIALWAQIKPLYQQFHAYVRRNLRLKYGEDVVSARGPIPAHLLGNMWAQTWTNVENFSKPYPNKTANDVTAALVAKNFTALKIFQTAEAFYKSLNLSAMTDSFWKNSIIERPSDGRDLVCHPSAWDFYDGKDYRIKQCTEITDEYYYSTHHEMGHIEYYMQYRHLPFNLRGGANPGFHEATGDTIGLLASSLKHLRAMDILPEGVDDEESNINQLYKMGLDKIAFLPFGYLLDLYRHGVFRGTTTPEDYNCHYWQFRESIQGIEPPTTRTEDDFDAAAKYHVSADVEYMRYYISYIIQYQFQRSLCALAGEYTPGDNSTLLFNCDIYNSTDAGNAFGKMLALGASKPWPDAMEVLTGQRNMDASGVLEYFQPLYEWLKADNEKNGEYIGWESSDVTFCTARQRMEMESSGFNERMNKYSASESV